MIKSYYNDSHELTINYVCGMSFHDALLGKVDEFGFDSYIHAFVDFELNRFQCQYKHKYLKITNVKFHVNQLHDFNYSIEFFVEFDTNEIMHCQYSHCSGNQMTEICINDETRCIESNVLPVSPFEYIITRCILMTCDECDYL